MMNWHVMVAFYEFHGILEHLNPRIPLECMHSGDLQVTVNDAAGLGLQALQCECHVQHPVEALLEYVLAAP